jgi:hypothetical protein
MHATDAYYGTQAQGIRHGIRHARHRIHEHMESHKHAMECMLRHVGVREHMEQYMRAISECTL